MKFTPKTQQKLNREGEGKEGRNGVGMLTSRLMHPGPPIWSEFL
jgi:hypothetical protein